MTQLSDVSEAVGDAIESDDAPALPKNGDELGDFLGLEEDDEHPEEGSGDEAEVEESDDEQEDEPAEPAIDPPASWKADAKEAFAALPPELQKVVSEREAQREAFVQTKAQEAASTRQTVENEARAVIAQQSQQMAQELQQYASMMTPERPDPAMLSYDPQGFYQAQSKYEAAVAQRDQAQRQAAIYEDQARQQAMAIEQAETQAEVVHLRSQFPEWYDPTTGPALQQELTATAKRMGYSETHISQARATDILAVRYVHEVEAKAAKWDAANKTKMEGVRAAKNLPKVAKPGVARTTDQNNRSKAEAAWQGTLGARNKSDQAERFADYLGLTGQL